MDIELPLQMANRIQHLREMRDELAAKAKEAAEDVTRAERDLEVLLRKYKTSPFDNSEVSEGGEK